MEVSDGQERYVFRIIFRIYYDYVIWYYIRLILYYINISWTECKAWIQIILLKKLSCSSPQPPSCRSLYTHTESLQREQLGFIPQNKSNNGWKPLKSLIDKKNEWSCYIWSKNKAWSLLLSDLPFRKDLLKTNLFVASVRWASMTQSTKVTF